MSIAIFVKMFSDACVCFGIMGGFSQVFTYSYEPVYAAVLCACGVTVAATLDASAHARFRWVSFLLPCSALLLADGMSNMLILLPVVVYTIVVILRRQYYLEYYSFRYNFRCSLMVMAGVFVSYCVISYLENLAGEYTLDTAVTLRYGIAHAIRGIFLQRHLRLGAENRAQGSRGQFAAILGGTGAVILGFTAAEPMLRRGAAVIVKLFVSILLAIPMMLYELYTYLVSKIDVERMQEAVAEATEESLPDPVQPVLQKYVYEALQQPREESGNGWVVFVMLLLICVMIWMIVAYGKKSSHPLTEETIAYIDEPDEVRRESRRSSRGRVRQYYREFLKMERKRGHVLKNHMTTEDILENITQDTNMQASSRLRQVYLLARYDETHEITKQQAEEAKTALKESRTA